MTLNRFALPLAALLLASCTSPRQASVPPARVQGAGTPEKPAAGYDAPPMYVNRSALLVGHRGLEKDTWAPLENQRMAAIEISRLNARTGTGFEFGMSGSQDSETVGIRELEMFLLEFSAGFRVQMTEARLRPFVGLGGAVTYADVDLDSSFGSDSESGLALGGYVHGGIHFEIVRDMDLVLEVRQRVGQDVDLNGSELDLDYLTIAVGVAF